MRTRRLFLLLIAVFMTAGCAMQEVVKKDDAGVTAPVSRPADRSKSDVTSPKQSLAATTPQDMLQSASDKQSRNASTVVKLHSALDKIYFDFDSENLSESARNTLTKNADVLKKQPAQKIRIEGNCDDRGSAEYNLALGERRAKSAQQYLITLGVKPELLSTISYGKEKPAVPGNDEASWAKNRRDEFVVLK